MNGKELIPLKNDDEGRFWPWRLSVAPMMAWTDRHCRYFHRLLTRRTRLYTEMITTDALIHGATQQQQRLRVDAVEHPVALQLGGHDPAALAHCARLGQYAGFEEINLNCGCPSERVQRGVIGACLMAEPQRVADCVKAMVDAVDVPVTVKHRIGIDRIESYAFVRDFVGTVADAGCLVFMVHARNAWLQGLSPKQNRNIPPLRHEMVYRLKRDFPHLGIVINGGIASNAAIEQHLAHVDGVMVGRAAYHDPWLLSEWDQRFLGAMPGPRRSRAAVEARMIAYMSREQTCEGTGWPSMARHTLGLYKGVPGARLWRQVWSDHRLRSRPVREVAVQATSALSAPAQTVA